MSEEKLKLSQKVFAALERLIRETPVHNLSLNFPITSDSIDFSLNTSVKTIPQHISATIQDKPVTITAQPVEILYQLTHPTIYDAAVESLTGNVLDEPIDCICTTKVMDETFYFSTATEVIDLFKKYRIDPKRMSSYIQTNSQSKSQELVKQVNFQLLKPVVHNLHQSKLRITPQIHENVVFFKRMILHKKAVVLSFLSEKEQLIYWRQAVMQTKKEPRKLQLIGVYTGIPYDYIDNIKVNYSQKSLNYSFKMKIPKKNSELRDIALFNDIDTNKVVLVLK